MEVTAKGDETMIAPEAIARAALRDLTAHRAEAAANATEMAKTRAKTGTGDPWAAQMPAVVLGMNVKPVVNPETPWGHLRQPDGTADTGLRVRLMEATGEARIEAVAEVEARVAEE
jgi:hypothetical protein